MASWPLLGPRTRVRKGASTLQQHRGHRRGPVEALGQQESTGSRAPQSCPAGRTHSTAAPAHPSPTGLQGPLLPPMATGARTPGTPLASTPCPGSAACWLQATMPLRLGLGAQAPPSRVRLTHGPQRSTQSGVCGGCVSGCLMFVLVTIGQSVTPAGWSGPTHNRTSADGSAHVTGGGDVSREPVCRVSCSVFTATAHLIHSDRWAVGSPGRSTSSLMTPGGREPLDTSTARASAPDGPRSLWLPHGPELMSEGTPSPRCSACWRHHPQPPSPAQMSPSKRPP